MLKKIKLFLFPILIVSVLIISSCSAADVINLLAVDLIDYYNITNYSTVTKTTPKGVSFSAYEINHTLTSTQITEINNYITNNYPNCTKVADPSLKYNCHTYAWYKDNTIWIDRPEQEKFFTGFNSSYDWKASSTSNTIPSAATAGMKVRYTNADHSAVVVDGTYFNSKFRHAGVYKHKPGDSPYVGGGFEYYKLK